MDMAAVTAGRPVCHPGHHLAAVMRTAAVILALGTVFTAVAELSLRREQICLAADTGRALAADTGACIVGGERLRVRWAGSTVFTVPVIALPEPWLLALLS